MVHQTKIFTAAVLGTIAFKAGRKCVPCHDSELMKLLIGNEVGEGLPVLNAWLTAWNDAKNSAEYYQSTLKGYSA